MRIKERPEFLKRLRYLTTYYGMDYEWCWDGTLRFVKSRSNYAHEKIFATLRVYEEDVWSIPIHLLPNYLRKINVEMTEHLLQENTSEN